MCVSVKNEMSTSDSEVGCFNSSPGLEYGNDVLSSQGPIAHQTIDPIQWNWHSVSDFIRITFKLEPKSKLEYNTGLFSGSGGQVRQSLT